jgi:diaminopimelate decarboxylase
VARTDDLKSWDLVGSICETGDFLGKDRTLSLQAGDVLAVLGAGAYGFVMSSNYNTRGRAAEVMVDGNHAHVVRQREAVESLWALEALLPE